MVEVATFLEAEVVDGGVRGGGAFERDIFRLLLAILHNHRAGVEVEVLVAQRRDDVNDVGQGLDGFPIVVSELLAGEHLGSGANTDDRKAKDPDDVGPKRGNQARDIRVEAINDRRDDDDSHDADDDAEHGEAGAQLVGAQGIERHADGFFLITDGHGELLSAEAAGG